MRSLKELKRAHRHKSEYNKAKSKSKIKSGSSHSIKLDLPLCESNKTKATSADTPPYTLPITPELFLALFDDKLNELERIEIKDYKKIDPEFQIYHMSTITARVTPPKIQPHNDGSGSLLCPNGTIVYFRYEIIGEIGKGSFGKVYKAIDHKDKSEVGLKIIKYFPKDQLQIDLEPEILLQLQQKAEKDGLDLTKYHINNPKHYFVYRLHKCLTMPIYEANLCDVLYEDFRSNGFPVEIIRTMTMQLLKCLKFLKSHNIIHCDLKPENIMLLNRHESDIVLIDFGSS